MQLTPRREAQIDRLSLLRLAYVRALCVCTCMYCIGVHMCVRTCMYYKCVEADCIFTRTCIHMYSTHSQVYSTCTQRILRFTPHVLNAFSGLLHMYSTHSQVYFPLFRVLRSICRHTYTYADVHACMLTYVRTFVYGEQDRRIASIWPVSCAQVFVSCVNKFVTYLGVFFAQMKINILDIHTYIHHTYKYTYTGLPRQRNFWTALNH
jgi:hypothetical protein